MQSIRRMNVTSYLKQRNDKQRRQIVFDGEQLMMKALWMLGERYFPS